VQSLIAFIQQILAWFLQFVDWILIEIFQVVGSAVLAVLNAIPLCGCFNIAATNLQALPSGVLFFAQGLDMAVGIQSILCGLLLRFLIRRIPFIG